jgi:hypothetical protein
MNPIFQMVIHRVIADIESRCRACDGRLDVVSNGNLARRRCARCGMAAAPRRSAGSSTVDVPAGGRPARWPSLRRGPAL